MAQTIDVNLSPELYMRTRKQDINGDFSFGHGESDYFINQKEGIAQIVKQRLRLLYNEWFNDITDGTRFDMYILGKYSKSLLDLEVRQRIKNSFGVLDITEYNSIIDANTRDVNIWASIDTIYGNLEIKDVMGWQNGRLVTRR